MGPKRVLNWPFGDPQGAQPFKTALPGLMQGTPFLGPFGRSLDPMGVPIWGPKGVKRGERVSRRAYMEGRGCTPYAYFRPLKGSTTGRGSQYGVKRG